MRVAAYPSVVSAVRHLNKWLTVRYVGETIHSSGRTPTAENRASDWFLFLLAFILHSRALISIRNVIKIQCVYFALPLLADEHELHGKWPKTKSRNRFSYCTHWRHEKHTHSLMMRCSYCRLIFVPR